MLFNLVFMLHPKRILVLGPHADDGEFGCGASIAKFIEQGKEVFYAVFSFAEESVPDGFPKDVLHKELEASATTLGIPSNHVISLSYRVRYFSYKRQEILEDMVKLRRDIQPDLVLFPNEKDVHQDHQVIAQESLRAFKGSSLLGYELPWNSYQFTPNVYLPVQKEHLEKKIKALKNYSSQRHRPYMDESFLEGLAKVRGTQAFTAYAEAFHSPRILFNP
jgi:LmbE family N-acetylglucosaminyl deacetylase